MGFYCADNVVLGRNRLTFKVFGFYKTYFKNEKLEFS